MESIKSIIINLDTAAAAVENELRSILKENQPGVYMAGRENPIFELNGSHFSHLGGMKGPIYKLDDIVGEVAGPDGRVVIRQEIAQNAKRMLSMRPSVPVFGRRIVAAYLEDRILKIALYRNNSGLACLGREYEALTDMSMDYDDFRAIVNDLAGFLRDGVYDFTGFSSWNVYECRREQQNFIVTNTGDWRVHDWERIQSDLEAKKDGNTLDFNGSNHRL